MSKRLGARAVVVGAGMGGLMAAESLSRFFDEVLVLEKDALTEEWLPRMGVPQGAHVHSLLVQGRRNLERLFPGLTSELLDRGAVCSRSGLEFALYDGPGWQPERDLGLSILTMSRPLLETTVREFVARNPRITIRQEVKVEGWSFQGERVTGVVTEDGTLAADLVVDATGRAGNPKQWLEAGGFGPLEEASLEIGTGYASALFKKPEGWKSRIDSIAVFPAAPDSRGGFIFSIEGGRMLCSLGGRYAEAPSGDPAAWMEFARTLCQPDIYEWISQCERLTPIKVFRAPVSRWRHYERLQRFPQGLLPVGDAVAHVNPLRGQGMTLASEHVRHLGEVLAERAAAGESLDGICRPYFQRIHEFTKMVWEGLETYEFTYATTKGDRPADIDGRIAFSKALRQLMITDAQAHRLMVEITQMVTPPSELPRSGVVDRVMALLKAGAPPEPVEA
jgi:2-polyprenyl-6-methoxyphenol hydroxylase-like FAD-dependent oxidoreductase